MTRIIHALICTLVALDLFIVVPFAWMLRDGLGPDSTTSTGLQAVWRCSITFYSGPILILLIIAAIGVGMVRDRSDKTQE